MLVFIDRLRQFMNSAFASDVGELDVYLHGVDISLVDDRVPENWN